MAVETFTYDPLTEPMGTKTFRVLEAKFGDGYAQNAADGLNNSMESWPLSFQGYDTEILPIKNFLDRHGGWKAFKWTPPLSEEGFYKAKSYTLTAGKGFNNYILNVTFEQYYTLSTIYAIGTGSLSFNNADDSAWIAAF